MKILHLCLACFYIDHYNYQENILPQIDKRNGHDVMIIASTETYINNSFLGYIAPGEYDTDDGIKLIRLPYVKIVNNTITRKARKYRGLYQKIYEFSPDIIFVHDLCFCVGDLIKYKRINQKVRIFADTHTAEYNSGKNWVSLHLLHRMFYKYHIQKAIPYVEKYFYIGLSERDFSIKNYGVPETKMEYFPLGGIIPSKEEYDINRKKKRRELGISEGQLLFIHSGKLTAQKRTEDLIEAFIKSGVNAVLVIIGSIPDERKLVLEPLIDEERVRYIGWKRADELFMYLCAGDLYCQPGSVSATLQQAICCTLPVLSFPHDEYLHINSFYHNFLFAKTTEDFEMVFSKINDGEIDLHELKDRTEQCAKKVLDYATLEQKYTS